MLRETQVAVPVPQKSWQKLLVIFSSADAQINADMKERWFEDY